MNIFKKFVRSIYKFDEYYKLIEGSVPSALLYYFVVSAVTIAIMCFSIFPVLTRVYNVLQDKIPPFVIEDGRLIAEDKLNINDEGLAVIIDSDAETAAELEAETDYVQGIFVSATDILVKSKLNNMENGCELAPFNGYTSDDLGSMFALMKGVSNVAVVLGLLFMKLVFLLFIWCLARLMSNLMRGGLGFKDCLKMGIYASTTAVLIKAVLSLTSVSMPNIIFYCLIGVYIYFGIDSCKKQKIS